VQKVKTYTALDESVIRTLLYYDIFHYPLKSFEVFRFIELTDVDENQVKRALDGLADDGFIMRCGEYYSIDFDQKHIARRIKGNDKAAQCMALAYRQAKLIARFPFTRGIMASGSLSKDYMDDASDLDFFIVTSPDRLWICRTLLVAFKRIFLKNSHRLFCVNYFVDAEHLAIEEKNIFTATELATLLPLYGEHYYRALHRANDSWLKKYFPHFQLRSCQGIRGGEPGFIKKTLEQLIGFFFGGALDKLCMQLSIRRWRQLYGQQYPEADFNIAFKSNRHTSKNHPNQYQKKVTALFQSKIDAFREKIELGSYE
jgi:hypothetical protein